MPTASYKLRLDPWAVEYDGALQLPEAEDERPADVDVGVETDGADWRPLRPESGPPPGRLVFVDGVRRIEHRLLIEDGERTIFGLLGSFAVGATLAESVASVAHAQVARIACAGGGLRLERLEAALPDGRMSVVFEPESVPENTPVAPLQGLQSAMRRAEAELAATLAAQAGLVILDGPLTFLGGMPGPVAGFVKRLLRAYLPVAQAPILRRLAVGERTPLFLIPDARHPRYSWYTRIGSGRAIDSSLTGVARLETWAGPGLDAARAMADLTTRELPRFASSSDHDPRAPQNLYPIGGLERHLRHLLGDPLLVRRAVESHLQRDVA